MTKLSIIGIQNYVKIRAHANPFLKEFGGYCYKHGYDKKAKSALTCKDFVGTVVPAGQLFEMLEPCDEKFSRMVFREKGASRSLACPMCKAGNILTGTICGQEIRETMRCPIDKQRQALKGKNMKRNYTLEYWTDDGWYVGRLNLPLTLR